MKRAFATILILILVGLGHLGCNSSSLDKVDGGGVLIVITDFDGLPVQVSVTLATAAGLVAIDEVVIANVPKDPLGVTSDLMNVEIQSYELTYSRADAGTRVPTAFVRGIFGVVPVGGTLTFDGLPILSLEQLRNTPLIDLFNLGYDSETGSQTILLNFHLRFFGRTLAGKAVETSTANFTIEFIQ
jgi:hypothetical protein